MVVIRLPDNDVDQPDALSSHRTATRAGVRFDPTALPTTTPPVIYVLKA